jgi:hypothetical protein
MSNINLLLDEENEITFALTVEGTTNSPAQCRLLVEKDNMTLMFEPNYFKNNEVSVTIPVLKNILKEGECNLSLEVIVEDKYFKPLVMKGFLEKSVEVIAESKAISKPKPQATASVSQIKVNNSTKNNIMTNPNKLKRKVSDNEILEIIKTLAGDDK